MHSNAKLDIMEPVEAAVSCGVAAIVCYIPWEYLVVSAITKEPNHYFIYPFDYSVYN